MQSHYSAEKCAQGLLPPAAVTFGSVAALQVFGVLMEQEAASLQGMAKTSLLRMPPGLETG